MQEYSIIEGNGHSECNGTNIEMILELQKQNPRAKASPF